jgi:O-antigen/teichoic acid export membrane protein
LVGKFAKPFIIYGIGTALVRFTSLLLIPLYTRVFSPAEYGVYDIITSLVTLLYIFGMMQLESGLARFYYEKKDPNDRVSLINTLFTTVFSLSSIISLIVVVFSNSISYLLFTTDEYSSSILYCALTIPAFNIYSYLTVLVRFEEKALLFIIISIVQLLIMISLSILLVVVLKIGLAGVFIGILAGFAVASLILILHYRKVINLEFNKYIIKELISFSLPQVPATIISWTNNYANRFVIASYLTLSENGLYSAAVKLGSVFLLIDTAIRMAWPPFFWKHFHETNHREIFQKVFSRILLGVFVCFWLYVLFAKEVFQLVTPVSFWSAGALLGVIGISNVLFMITNVVGMGPDIAKKTHFNIYFSLMALITNFSSLYFLLPIFGLLAVTLSLLISNVVLLAAFWIFSEQVYYIGYSVKLFLVYMLISISICLLVYYFDISFFLKLSVVLAVISFAILFFKSQILQTFNSLKLSKQ